MLLDEKTIGKIAAGEVIERPSSIVKELIENSLDANSNNITIEIRDGGKTYIRITDDGDGINKDDLDLAFKRHSTSKLSSVEDLYKIRSLGFRGEALASISQVSKVEVMTKTADVVGGIHAVVENGEIKSKEVIGCPKGTTIIVKDLFYNLPVRKEFLRSDLTESNHIADIVYKIAIGNTGTSFRFIKDDKVVLKTSRNNDMKSHIYSILGREFTNNMIGLNSNEEGIQLTGFISNNNLYRSNRNHQYVFINGRYISNINIANIIEENYKTLIPVNRYPCFIIFMELDPSTIDVNIHPTKQEVKFSNQSKVFTVIKEACKIALNSSLTIPQFGLRKENKVPDEEQIPLLFELSSNTSNNGITENLQNNNEDSIKKDLIIKDFTSINSTDNSCDNILIKEDIQDMNQYEDVKDDEEDIKTVLSNIKPIGILFNTYILAEDRVSEKIYFIDQHAAHERVMYEKYLREYKSEQIVIQQLLVPEIIELTTKEMNTFLENINTFKELGFDVNEFGSNGVAIRGVPIIFGKPNVSNLFFDILDNIENVKSSYDTKLDKIMKIACTKAVKGGDTLSEKEMFALFEQLQEFENPQTCPHGRPIIVEMTKQEIEKAFLRIN